MQTAKNNKEQQCCKSISALHKKFTFLFKMKKMTIFV